MIYREREGGQDDELTLADVDDTIRELERLLAQARDFRAKALLGKLTTKDTFICFRSVIENGYDVTGPNEVIVED